MPPTAPENGPDLIVRADASPEIGTGHFMRCLALAEAAIARRGRVTFVTHCTSTALLDRAAAVGAEIISVAAMRPDATDVQQVRAARDASGADSGPWIVIDGYHFDAAYQERVRDIGAPVLVIDDLVRDRADYGDVMLNQNTGAESAPYPAGKCVYLLGPRFCLLRNEFVNVQADVGRPVRRDAALRVLVTLGGADDGNVTADVMRTLAALPVPLRVRVIAGPANPHVEGLRALVRSGSGNLELVAATNEMAREMARADIAIAAAGSTTWELAALGIPAILVVTADNQDAVAAGVHAHGAAINLGRAAAISPSDLGNAVLRLHADPQLRAQMGERGRSLVDGRGRMRVLSIMNALLSGEPERAAHLRPAVEEDALQLLRLANDPTVRAAAFTHERIEIGQHMSWFTARLRSPDSLMWVLDLHGLIVGQIRYDRVREAAEISFAVHAALRGRGVGTSLLQRTWQPACETLSVSTVRGSVITGNHASARSFEKAGFTCAAHSVRDGTSFAIFERTADATV